MKLSLKARAIISFFCVVIVVGVISDAVEGSKKTSNQPASSPTPPVQATTTPTATLAPALTLEQKQADFKEFYKRYQKQGQNIILVQTTLLKIANMTSSREELYLSLDKLAKMQDELSSLDNIATVPDSLKEYPDLKVATFNLQLSARHFKSAIENFQIYLDKNDLKKLTIAKEKSDLGTAMLVESKDMVDKVALELKLDLKQLMIDSR